MNTTYLTRLATGGLLATAIALGGTAAQAASGGTITEGVGGAGLSIGMSRSAVVAAYPSSDCSTGNECYVPGAGGYVTIRFGTNGVGALEFDNAGSTKGWSTTAGVSAGSSLQDVASIYGVSVNGDTVLATSRGYAAKEVKEYLCNDSGCSVSGTHLRHTVFAPGTTTMSVGSSSAQISVSNTGRKTLSTEVTITLRDSAGRAVATATRSVYLPPRTTWVAPLDEVVEISDLSAGSYRWSATATNRNKTTTLASGSATVVNAQVPVVR